MTYLRHVVAKKPEMRCGKSVTSAIIDELPAVSHRSCFAFDFSGLRSSITRVGETDLGSSGCVEMTVKTGTDAGCIGANPVRRCEKTHRER